jgi:hypothetical protein
MEIGFFGTRIEIEFLRRHESQTRGDKAVSNEIEIRGTNNIVRHKAVSS